jgi:hypothetical protein
MYSSSRGTPEAFTAFINPSADINDVSDESYIVTAHAYKCCH